MSQALIGRTVVVQDGSYKGTKGIILDFDDDLAVRLVVVEKRDRFELPKVIRVNTIRTTIQVLDAVDVDNDLRSARGLMALRSYLKMYNETDRLQERNSFDEAIQDLISDLLHTSRMGNSEAQLLLDRAYANFEAERVEEGHT